MVFDLFTLVEAIWLILPAYAANGLVPLFGGKHPIDGGGEWKGRRILGPGKTWEGLAGGIIIGAIVGIVQQAAYPFLPFSLSPVMLLIAPMSPLLGAVLGFGAMAGDASGSFIKRRFGIERGRPAPLLDQEDFLIGSLFFASLATQVKPDWFVLLFFITPFIHIACNIFAYVLRLKKEPW